MKSTISVWLFSLVLILSVGCAEKPAATSTPTHTSAPQTATPTASPTLTPTATATPSLYEGTDRERNYDQAQHKDMNEQLAEIGSRVPEFGGLFMSADQRVINVYWVGEQKSGDIQRAQEAIADTFGTKRIPQDGIRLIQGDYTMAQLSDWYSKLRTQKLWQYGVNMKDLDESKNRIFIGTEGDSPNEAAIKAVQEILANLNIPREAVIIEPAGTFSAPQCPLSGPC
ncbi:MAG: hypothetical protein FJ320_01045 [SAR202 cluster bacterium]|nr:hypothetical protein [SAR202 cluster bacterium]